MYYVPLTMYNLPMKYRSHPFYPKQNRTFPLNNRHLCELSGKLYMVHGKIVHGFWFLFIKSRAKLAKKMENK